ncbi:hypothetical protein [Glycomyces harbinensis]|uniref:PE family protein n=1 Tax=Glycomyces harbinensis TaxID=58114 RepID=A0A1G6Y2T8_9ACTN|nr:hypothetical protein [Glycomyces harbinensis]SDD84660.1 hypothetical protein SAMN05216270_108100 [Glycomyces harbinensis]
MASTSKQVDPEALRAYRTKVQAQLDIVENEIIPKLRNGEVLGKMPAFGAMAGSDAARGSYETFHTTTWENLQALRESLHGIIDTLEESGNLHEETDQQSAADYEGAL